MGEPEQLDHAPAGFPLGQSLRERGPGVGIFGAGKEPVAVDRAGQCLGLAPQGVDHVTIIDAVDTPTIVALAQARMADDMGPPEPCLDPVVVDMDAEALADQARRRAVEDAVHEEAAGAGNAGDDLGEVGGAPGRQRPQRRRLGAQGSLAAAVAAGDELIDEAAPVGDIGEVTGAAQDQRLVERGLEMAVVGFHRAVLMRFAGIVAAG